MENIDINEEKTIIIEEKEFIHQLKNVFRYKTGQKINIFNDKEGEFEVEIIEIGKKDMSLKYIRHITTGDFNKKQKRQVSLYMSIIKNSNFELIVEKAVELGVYEIIPVITQRTIKSNLNIERIKKIIKEATEQSGRVDLMKIGDICIFNNCIKTVNNFYDEVYFGSIDQSNGVNSVNEYKDKIALFVGPEGGYSEEEISLFVDNKIKPLKLGDYVLRAETAAILGCGLMSL